jgi:hypothetical protein
MATPVTHAPTLQREPGAEEVPAAQGGSREKYQDDWSNSYWRSINGCSSYKSVPK